MQKPVSLVLLLAAALVPWGMLAAGEVLTLSSYGGDGDETYYQVVCSDNSEASLVVGNTSSKICVYHPTRKTLCEERWTLRKAAAAACR